MYLHEHDRVAGYFELEQARVKWFLSIEHSTIPLEVLATGNRTFKSLAINGETFKFNDYFTNLHTRRYNYIPAGNGFPLQEAKTAIEIVHDIRTQKPIGLKRSLPCFCRNAVEWASVFVLVF